MSDEPINSSDAIAEIETLARETEMPVALVQRIYVSERAKFERTARIKIYLPVLVHRHVKQLLRQVKEMLRERRAAA
jgi:Protein of unknown function (DUF3562)